jgi:hypothetical protein
VPSLGIDGISYQKNIDTTTSQGALIFMVLTSTVPFAGLL